MEQYWKLSSSLQSSVPSAQKQEGKQLEARFSLNKAELTTQVYVGLHNQQGAINWLHYIRVSQGVPKGSHGDKTTRSTQVNYLNLKT